jgi:hypothetical protein
MAPRWWPIQLTRYRPTSLSFALAGANVIIFPVVALGLVAQQQQATLADTASGAALIVVVLMGLALGAHNALLAWRVGVTVDPSTVTVTRYWTRRTVPRPEILELNITHQGRRLLGSLRTQGGELPVWTNYLGRHRHQLQVWSQEAVCLSCDQERATLRELARDLGVHANEQ